MGQNCEGSNASHFSIQYTVNFLNYKSIEFIIIIIATDTSG